MKTKRSISGISWNSVNFAELVLNDLVEEGQIMFYAFIHHKAESLDKKDHLHIYIEPNQAIYTETLVERLTEYPSLDQLPIKPSRVWNPSKFPDWLLYGLHNKSYLVDKGLKKEFEYNITDVKTNDYTVLYERYQNLETCGDRKKKYIDDMISLGANWSEVVCSGIIPINQIRYYKEYFSCRVDYLGRQNKYIEKIDF